MNAANPKFALNSTAQGVGSNRVLFEANFRFATFLDIIEEMR